MTKTYDPKSNPIYKYIPSVKPRHIPEEGEIPLDHPSLYFNIELGWLDFNWRVLYQALDERLPLMERIRFVAITANNLDEFIQKRVGGLKRQLAAGVQRLSPDGRLPTQQLDLVRKTIDNMQQLYTDTWQKELMPQLKSSAKIDICDWSDLSKKEKSFAKKYYHDHIYPILTPLAVDPGHPFPFISNLSLSLAIAMHHPVRGTTHFARVKVPASHGRWLSLSHGKRYRLVPIEQVIANCVDELFVGMHVDSVHAFRIARNADVRRDEEEAEDLLAMISEELRERRFAPVVRLEYEKGMPGDVRHLLARELELEKEDLFQIDGQLNLSDLFYIADLDRPELKYEPWAPVIPNSFILNTEHKEAEDVFSIIRKRDILVHHPYESFTASVQRFIEDSAADPQVIAIKQTLYRTSQGSPTVDALMKAADAGKQVAVLVEVTARFDEAKNIEFGQMLENAGVHVTYGLVGLKTHCKTTLVIREEDDGPRAYCHIGTGNYHATTARLYTDFGLFTCRPDIANDVINLFHYLTGHAPDQTYRQMLIAPRNMRQIFYNLIDREIQFQREKGTGKIICKMNALDDITMIHSLYRASQAGVAIKLIVRGHCRLRPGIPGVSDNIEVISIIGRFLEHDRLFYFHNDGDPEVFFGSADWRRRNLSDRVEAIIRVQDKRLRNRLISILEYALRDNRLAWDLLPDGRYIQRMPTKDERERNFHSILMRRALRYSRAKDLHIQH